MLFIFRWILKNSREKNLSFRLCYRVKVNSKNIKGWSITIKEQTFEKTSLLKLKSRKAEKSWRPDRLWFLRKHVQILFETQASHQICLTEEVEEMPKRSSHRLTSLNLCVLCISTYHYLPWPFDIQEARCFQPPT